MTFIFDCILAYEITEKIYNIKAENSFQNIPPYTVSLAFNSVNFWLIIFAGFVVYLIWGFVFDFVMEAYGKLDQINNLISEKEKDIKDQEKELNKLDEETNKLNQSIGENNTEIEKLKTKLDSEIIKPRELEHSLMRFLDGWLEYLNFNNRPELERQNAHKTVDDFVTVNIKSLQIITLEK